MGAWVVILDVETSFEYNMTNKKKQRAKALSKASGMSHEAAMNVLNKNRQKATEDTSEDVPEGYVLRPTLVSQASAMDQELLDAFGPQEEVSSEMIESTKYYGPCCHGVSEKEMVLHTPRDSTFGALYTRTACLLGGKYIRYVSVSEGINPEFSVNKPTDPKLIPKNPVVYSRPPTKPSKDIKPQRITAGYRGYHWFDLKSLGDLRKLPTKTLYDVKSFPAVTIAALANSIKPEGNDVIVLLTNRRLNKEGKSPVVVLSISYESFIAVVGGALKAPKWLSKYYEPVKVSDPRKRMKAEAHQRR